MYHSSLFFFPLKSLILLICEFLAILEKFPCRTCLEFLARVLKQSWRRLETAGFWWANQGSMPHVLARVRCTWACLMMLLISTQRTSQVQSWKMMKWISPISDSSNWEVNALEEALQQTVGGPNEEPHWITRAGCQKMMV